MKKLLVAFITLLSLSLTLPVYAEYSSEAYGGVGKETFLTRTSDWFATLGKSQEEKYRIKHERRTARKIKKAKKRIEKQKRDFAKKRNAFKR